MWSLKVLEKSLSFTAEKVYELWVYVELFSQKKSKYNFFSKAVVHAFFMLK